MFSREVEIVLGVLVMVFLALQFAAKRRPGIAWLRAFRMPELSPAQQRRARRRGNIFAGVEFILLALVIPMGYVALTVMTFSRFDPMWTTFVILSSALCLILGIVAIARNARG